MGKRGLTIRGVLAGLVGATVLAFWFLVVDAAQGAPFRTPALLAASLFGVEGLEARPGLIIVFMSLHYLAFVVVGTGSAWTLHRLEAVASIPLGLVLGLLLFNLAFYGSVAITGLDVVEELGWVEVLAGNLIAGVCMMGFLQAAEVGRPVSLWWALTEHRVVREGVVAGILGAAVVALWFFALDLIQGQPLFTPAALGSALFLGVDQVADVRVTFWTVAGYTLIHGAAFILVAFVASAILFQVERTPPLLLGAILLFVVFEAMVLALLAAVGDFLLGPLARWSIAGGNLLAVFAVGYYLWTQHPKLREIVSGEVLDRTA